MVEENRFHFGGADDVPDGPIFQEDVQSRRIERLGRRVTLIFILLPCLFGLLLYYGYRDLSGRMSRTQDSGLEEVQKLSEDILDKFNGLSLRLEELASEQATVEKSLLETRALLEQKTAASESANAAAASSAQTNTKSIENLNDALAQLKATKLDRADFNTIDARLESALVPLQKEIAALGALREEIEALAPLREEIDSIAGLRKETEDLSGRLSALENSLGKDLNAFATYVEKTNRDMEQIQSSISAMAEDKIGQEKLRLELLKVNKSNRLVLLQEITKIQKTLNTLEEKVARMERSTSGSTIVRPPSADQKTATMSRAGRFNEQELAD